MGKVRYELLDGCIPEKSDGVMRLKSPLDMNLDMDSRLSVGLGVKFSVPVIILENPYMTKQGLSIANAGSLVLPGVEVSIDVELSDRVNSLEIERRQTIVFALPLESNFELESQ